jgi:hypothetical protein
MRIMRRKKNLHMAVIILFETAVIPLIFHTFQNAEYRGIHNYNFTS